MSEPTLPTTVTDGDTGHETHHDLLHTWHNAWRVPDNSRMYVPTDFATGAGPTGPTGPTGPAGATGPSGASGGGTLPPTTDGVRYLSGTGDDANDGLTQGSAKRTLAAAYADLPATGGTLLLTPGRYDVGAGLALVRGKPVQLFGLVGPYPYIGSTTTVPLPATFAAVLYSSTGAASFITTIGGTGSNVLDGLRFSRLVFEFSASTSLIGIDADTARYGEVDHCLFFADITSGSPGPASNAVQGMYVRRTTLGGTDASWWRVHDNHCINMALGTFGNDSGTAQDNNQHVIRDNVGLGAHHYLTYSTSDATTARPFIKIRGGNRCVVRDNNIEAYGTGVYWDGCFGCQAAGNGGEIVDVFHDMYNCKGMGVDDVGIAEAALALSGRTLSADGVTTSGSATITSASGAFVAGDKGRVVRSSAVAVPAGARVLTVNSSTSITLDQNCTASTTSNTFRLDANMRSAVLVRADSFTRGYTINMPTAWVDWDPGQRTDYVYEATDAGAGAASWATGVTYSAGQHAVSGGVPFVCMSSNASTNTVAPENDTTHWQQLHPSLSMGSTDGVITAPRTTKALDVPWAGGPANIAASALIVATASSDQTYTSSSTAMQDDTALQLVMSGNGTDIWQVDATLYMNTANGTMDLKVGWNVGATGATGDIYVLNQASTSLPGMGDTGTTFIPTASAGLTSPVALGSATGLWAVALRFRILDGGTSGTIKLQLAQNTSDVGSIVRKTGSNLIATKLT